ncbi:Cadherin-18 [Liparis tanakae]|uniref:Cadherin-18 n=1 Tax=Liparis tanakae TaxID=230148 RepID=A0A4Z2GSK0_9TELE|nr:Cadherin-18 [Liparis tanakae]
MDREGREHYTVVIQAKDMAGQVGGLSGSTTINITLTDVNDNPPMFPQKNYQLYVPESAQVGKAVGKIKANDKDLGINADIKYSIINSEGANMFSISTERDTREGVISLKKPLNYERKKTYTLTIEGTNTHVDPRFSYLGSFKDTTTLKITVGDVDEAPVFSIDHYIMDVYENSPSGTEVGSVTARDPDGRNSPVRYFLDSKEEGVRCFRIDETSGLIRTTLPLDREDVSWHNITVMASELIQTVAAVDKDDFANGQRFSFALPSLLPVNPNFTLKDNQAIVVVFVTLRRSKKEPLIISEEDVRENVVTYDDEGGGEEDTEAFDIIALRNPAAAEELKFRRDVRPDGRKHCGGRHRRRSASTTTEPDEPDVHEFIRQRLAEADMDTGGPPYDSLQTYAYEGQGSPTGSVSPLDTPATQSEQDYNYLDNWGPQFHKLAELYAEADSEAAT